MYRQVPAQERLSALLGALLGPEPSTSQQASSSHPFSVSEASVREMYVVYRLEDVRTKEPQTANEEQEAFCLAFFNHVWHPPILSKEPDRPTWPTVRKQKKGKRQVTREADRASRRRAYTIHLRSTRSQRGELYSVLRSTPFQRMVGPWCERLENLAALALRSMLKQGGGGLLSLSTSLETVYAR